MYKRQSRLGQKLVIAALLSISVAVSLPTPSSADSCVSDAEFVKIRNGMTEAKIKSLTGASGRTISSVNSGKDRVMVKFYPACNKNKYGAVVMGFLGGKLNYKKLGIS